MEKLLLESSRLPAFFVLGFSRSFQTALHQQARTDKRVSALIWSLLPVQDVDQLVTQLLVLLQNVFPASEPPTSHLVPILSILFEIPKLLP